MIISKRAGLSAALASVVLAALVMPATAQASSPSVQLWICNGRNQNQTHFVNVFGTNHNNQQARWTTRQSRGQCTHTDGWWWKIGTTVRISHGLTDNRRDWYCSIPSSARNGSSLTCTYS